MKCRRTLLALLLLLLLLAAVAGAVGWHRHVGPGPLAEATTVVVPRGEGLLAVGRRLEAAGVIADAEFFALAAKLSERRGRVQAGEYAFAAAASTAEVIALLQSGRTVVRRLTVPEGLTVAQAVELLQAAEALTGEITVLPPEGALLPETYHYAHGDSRDGLIARMRRAMDEALAAAWAGRAPGLPLRNEQEALILASIVERETALAAERPRIAAVFLNRLRLGMRLQSDPTVIYGLSGGSGVIERPLGRDDLALPTPYNTYTIDGLPPTPIGNPGRAAIAAVLSPLATEELYFVADGGGGHVFARTLEEHNRNVINWRKFERARRNSP